MSTKTHGADVHAAAALRAVLGTTTHTGSPALKNAVRAFVDEAMLLGWPIERIIVTMKRIASDDQGAGEVRYAKAPESRSEASRIAEQAISWAIAHYYGEPAR